MGLNLLSVTAESGGPSRYARELIPAMLEVAPDTRIVAFVAATAPEDLLRAPWAGEVEWVRFPVRGAGAPWRLLADMGGIPASAARRRLDVVHGLTNIAPLVAPGVATVVTLLDLIWLRHPDTMERWPTLAMRTLAPACARAADRVIAISAAARADIASTLCLDGAKIDVTPLGVRQEPPASVTPGPELRRRLGIGTSPYVLSVAQKRRHKNLSALVEALPALPGDVHLVLPGSHTPHEEELRARAESLGLGARLHLPGWVSEPDLEGLYREAVCFALPSFEEGFGLPVLEAMLRGLPVACANTSSLPGVAGNAALLFDPSDSEDIGNTLRRLLHDPRLRADLAARGRERCRRFTWEATTKATLVSYRRALEQRARQRGRRT